MAVFDTAFLKLGVYICYDRHFPEYLRALALAGAELVVVPQAGAIDEWPEGLYEAELRVAAFQNGYFAALCHRVGEEEKLTFAGVEGRDVYNITAPFEAGGETVIAGRVEARDSERAATVFFTCRDDVWRPKPGAPVFEGLQDPCVARIAGELLKFAMSGQLYRGSKPVMWSVVERTALIVADSIGRDPRHAASQSFRPEDAARLFVGNAHMAAMMYFAPEAGIDLDEHICRTVALVLGPMIDRFGAKKMLVLTISLVAIHAFLLAETQYLWENATYVKVMLAAWVLLGPVTMVCMIALAMTICSGPTSATQFAIYMSLANLGSSAGSKTTSTASRLPIPRR